MKSIGAGLVTILVIFATACATGTGTLRLGVTVDGGSAESVVVSHESISDDDLSEDPVLIVKSEPSGARVMLDSRFVGRTPLVVDNVKPGEYTITVSGPGYRPYRHVVRLRSGSRTTLDVTLRLITGYLAIAPFERDVEYAIAGTAVEEPIVELSVGSYFFRARKFGYRDFTRLVDVNDSATTYVSPVFEPAPLAVTSFRVSRRILNPANPGLTGTLGISFEVTAPGTAEVEIHDAGGTKIWSTHVPRFTTWAQSTSWRGADDAGAAVPDGPYTVVLTVRDDDTVLSRTLSFHVDRSAVIAARSLWSVGAGSMYAPTTDTLPRFGTQLSFSAGRRARSALAPAFVPITAAARFGLGSGLELGVLGRIEAAEADGTDRYGIFGYGSFGFYDKGHRVRVSASAIMAAGYQSAPVSGPESRDRFSSPFGVSALLPVQLGIGALRITVGPELAIAPYDRVGGTPDGFSPTYSARVRAGTLLDFGRIVTAASATFPVPLPGDSTPSRTIHSGAELHWLIPGTYLVVSGLVFSALEPAERISWGGAAGFGVLY
ncbi:MAG: PEGA domain-containing protein [Spirochaetaceae bacterium]|nr:MAG: PEGA domain-containing protein [Spirochaetaceae bacterium]